MKTDSMQNLFLPWLMANFALIAETDPSSSVANILTLAKPEQLPGF